MSIWSFMLKQLVPLIVGSKLKRTAGNYSLSNVWTIFDTVYRGLHRRRDVLGPTWKPAWWMLAAWTDFKEFTIPNQSKQFKELTIPFRERRRERERKLGHLVESLLTCSFHFIARWVADALRRIRTTTEFFMARPILHLTCLTAVELPTYAAGASRMGVAEFAWAHIRKRRHRYQGKHVECYEWGYANPEYY